jgi:hypothetical protein
MTVKEPRGGSMRADLINSTVDEIMQLQRLGVLDAGLLKLTLQSMCLAVEQGEVDRQLMTFGQFLESEQDVEYRMEDR